MRTPLWRRPRYRGAALIFFGLLDLVYAFSLFNPPASARRSASLQFVASIAPLWAWALLWLIPGLLCAAQAFMRADRVAFTSAIVVKVIWGLLYVVGWITGGLERAYVGATVWLALAGFVAIIAAWPEPPAARRGGRHGGG